MRILRSYLAVPPVSGGMESHIAELSKRQNQLGHDVTVAFNNGEKIFEGDIQILPSFDLKKRLKTPFGFLVFYVFLAINLLWCRKKYDVVHIHGDWSSYLLAPIIKMVSGSKCVFFSFHGQAKNRFSHRKLLPLTLKFADVVFCTGYDSFLIISQYAISEFQPSGVKDLFFEKNKTSRIPNQICCVSVLRKFKNVETVLDIAELLPEYSFIIVGDGECRVQLQSKANALKLRNVKFVGSLDPAGVKKILDSSRLFLSTSLEEGTSTAVMEAMVCGLPIVSSGAGGLSALINDGIDGFIIEGDYRKADLYVEAIREAMVPSKNLAMSRSVEEKASRFGWGNISKRITEIMSRSI